MYASYFVIVAYVSFFQANTFRELKHSYKISLMMTFGAIIASVVLLIAHGYSPTQAGVHGGPTKYVSFVALLNLYLWLISYLYSPSVESLEDL